jgi:hypothetical protein
MSISALKENTFLIDQIKFASQRNKRNDKEQSDLTDNLKSSHKDTSTEQKSTVVSEKINEQTPFVSYNFRIQPGVPLSKSAKSERTYNDSRKQQTIEVEDQETGELLESELIVEDKPNEDRRGKEFYVNLGNSIIIKKQTKSLSELFQEKINSIYNVGFTREPGTLVNLMF